MPYEQAREQLLTLAEGDDPLVAVTGHQWHVVSPVDAFLLLGKHLIFDDINAFGEQVAYVLGELDPALSMPPSERWRANIDGKVPLYSPALRGGMATGLALLGTFGEAVSSATGLHGEQWAGQIISPLLQAANADLSGDLWASVAEELPLLIEAAPRNVIESIRAGTKGQDPVLKTIFQDDPGTSTMFNSRSPHSSFLWAIERASWPEEHLVATSELLAILTTLDPGGRLSNRPSASLANIYHPRRPGTAADQDARFAAIDRLRNQWPDVAWPLMLSLLPSARGIRHLTASPIFREWKKKTHSESTLADDYSGLLFATLDRLRKDADVSADRWRELLLAHQHLPPPLRRQVRESFDEIDTGQWSEDNKRTLWSCLHGIVTHHREYADATWAMPAEDLVRLDDLATRVAPLDTTILHSWLFSDDFVELGDRRRRDDLEAYDAEVKRRRVEAIREIVDKGGLPAAIRFAENVRAHIVGFTLADAYQDTHLETVLEWLDRQEPEVTIGSNYIWRRGRAEGLEWTLGVIRTHPELCPDVKARLFDGVDELRVSWQAVQELGADVERAYWKRFAYFGRGVEFDGLLTAADNLGRVGRWAAALDLLALYSNRVAESADFANAASVREDCVS